MGGCLSSGLIARWSIWMLIRSCEEALWVFEVGEEGVREVGVDW